MLSQELCCIYFTVTNTVIPRKTNVAKSVDNFYHAFFSHFHYSFNKLIDTGTNKNMSKQNLITSFLYIHINTNNTLIHFNLRKQ